MAGDATKMPNVDKAKWVSNGKATIQWCDRWAGDKGTAEVNF